MVSPRTQLHPELQKQRVVLVITIGVILVGGLLLLSSPDFESGAATAESTASDDGAGRVTLANSVQPPDSAEMPAESESQQESDHDVAATPSQATAPPTPDGSAPQPETSPGSSPATAPAASPKDTLTLFNGKNLDGWEVTKFGGEGEVHVADGQLILPMGVDLTGVTWKNEAVLPRTNYEVTLEGMRVDGNDFFCGITFPVKKDPCSLILGGWGGGVCGLSSIDGYDASENETTTYRPFEKGRWYKIRLRVTDDRIDAWIDDEPIVELEDLTDRELSIRYEVELSVPFGIASWQTTAALRNIQIRKLSDVPAKDAPAKDAPVPES